MTEFFEKKFPMPSDQKGQSLPIVARQLTELAPSPTWRVEIRDQIEISAKKPSQIYSLASCLEMAASVGHLEDFSGDATPLIERRWLQCSIDLLDEVKDLSADERLAQFERWCLTALQLGYNGLFLGEGFDYNGRWPFKVSSFQALASKLGCVARSFGLSFGLDISRWGSEHKVSLPELVLESRADSLFHARLQETFGRGEGLLRDERLLLGIERLRSLCPADVQLIAHLLPEHFGNEESLPLLLARLPRNCLLSFCALGDIPSQIFGRPHPLWRVLRAKFTAGTLPLLPIFNPGQGGWGGGLWPTVPVLEWEGLLQRCVKEGLTSALALTPRLPPQPGFLRAALWCFGQRLWRAVPIEDLLETWLAACCTDWNFPKDEHLGLLQLSKSLQRLMVLKTDGCDLSDVEVLRKSIALLRMRLPRLLSGSQLLQSVQLFLTDARHLLIAALQDGVGAHQGTQYHALLQALLQEQVGEEGIWTEIRGSGAGARVSWRAMPLATRHRGSEVLSEQSGYVLTASSEQVTEKCSTSDRVDE